MPIHVILSNDQRVYGLSKREKDKLESLLTFENPKYVQAARWSRWGPPKTIPQFLRYYRNEGRYISIPLHFPLPFSYKVVADGRVSKPVKWPKLTVDLREGQKRAFNAYLRNPENGQVILDTGEGKTILAYAIAAALGQRALILVDRVAYMKPWVDDIQLAFGGKIKKKDIGIIKASQYSIGNHVTIAFFQTLNNRDLSKLSREFGIIIHDESDTAAAPTRFSIVHQFKSRYRLAVSGTKERSDGLQFLHSYLYGGFAVDLQGQGKNILSSNAVKVRVIDTEFNCKVPFRFSSFKRFDSNGDAKDFDSTVDHIKLREFEARDPASNQIKLFFIRGALKQGEPCLVLTHRVFHAIQLGLAIKKKGYKCRILYGGTPVDLKDKIIDEAASGKIQCVVSTFHYIKRGANVPRWSRGFAMTQTANETELRQAIGRIRRTNKGKKSCIWYDFICPKIRPYKRYAVTRQKLWKDMGFDIEYVKLPSQFRRD